MALFTLTINNLAPAFDKKNQEVERIARYLGYAAQAVQSTGGALTNGSILDNSNTVMGTWIYTPQAAS